MPIRYRSVVCSFFLNNVKMSKPFKKLSNWRPPSVERRELEDQKGLETLSIILNSTQYVFLVYLPNVTRAIKICIKEEEIQLDVVKVYIASIVRDSAIFMIVTQVIKKTKNKSVNEILYRSKPPPEPPPLRSINFVNPSPMLI